jgi:hypothetical protein
MQGKRLCLRTSYIILNNIFYSLQTAWFVPKGRQEYLRRQHMKSGELSIEEEIFLCRFHLGQSFGTQLADIQPEYSIPSPTSSSSPSL